MVTGFEKKSTDTLLRTRARLLENLGVMGLALEGAPLEGYTLERAWLTNAVFELVDLELEGRGHEPAKF